MKIVKKLISFNYLILLVFEYVNIVFIQFFLHSCQYFIIHTHTTIHTPAIKSQQSITYKATANQNEVNK